MTKKVKTFYRDLFRSDAFLELRKIVLVQMYLAWTLPFYTVAVVMYIKRMSIPSIFLGVTLTIVVIGSVLGHNLSSLLITRFLLHPKQVLKICMPMILVCNFSFLWVTESYYLLTALFFGLGFLVGVNFTSVNVIYREYLPDDNDEREKVSANFLIIVNISAGLSGVVVTSFIEKSMWNLPDILFGIVATIVLYRIQATETRIDQEQEAVKTKSSNLLSLKWKLAVIALPILIVSVILRAIDVYFPQLVGTQSGILITSYFVVNGFTGPLITWMVKKTSRRKVINGCLILIGASSLAMSLGRYSFLVLLIIAVNFGFAARGILTCTKTEMESFAEQRTDKRSASASTNSTFQTNSEAGKVAGAYLVSYLLSNPLLWCFVALACVLILINRETLEKKLH